MLPVYDSCCCCTELILSRVATLDAINGVLLVGNKVCHKYLLIIKRHFSSCILVTKQGVLLVEMNMACQYNEVLKKKIPRIT